MSQNLTHRVLLDESTATSVTGNWIPLDYRVFSGLNTMQTLIGTVATGDTVYIEATNELPFVNGVPQTITAIATVSSFTGPFYAVLDAPVAAIRARKTGTAGTVKVVGLLV